MKIIDSITIRYFRSVYTLNIGQCEDITIVSGRNDVGKSNILKALNFLLFLFLCHTLARKATKYLLNTILQMKR